MTDKTYTGYVRTETGAYLVQYPDRNRWGFCVASDDQEWPGGFGIATSWEPVSADDVPSDIHDQSDWILAEVEQAPAIWQD